MKRIKLLDTVALIKQIPRSRLTLVDDDCEYIESLPPGQVGTIDARGVVRIARPECIEVEVYERGETCQYHIYNSDQTCCE